MIKSGIYKILNLIDGKFYIGSTANFIYRWKLYEQRLNYGDHHSQHLQAAWNKYSADNFEFIALEGVEDLTKLIEREQWWIDFTKCYNKKIGYNVRKIAQSCIGIIRNEQSKLKSSIAIKSSEKFRKYSQSRVGRPRKQETKDKLSLAHIGKIKTEEHRRKISQTLTGRKTQPCSEEKKIKIAASLRKRKQLTLAKITYVIEL